MSTYNVELTEEAKNYILHYQLARKIETKLSQFGVQKCINEIILEHKLQAEEIVRLQKTLENCEKSKGS